jgi:hypothetical protein
MDSEQHLLKTKKPLFSEKLSVPNPEVSGWIRNSISSKQKSLSVQRSFLCPIPKYRDGFGTAFPQNKKASLFREAFCAQDWIRTSTPFPALPPQGSASTNFATWA